MSEPPAMNRMQGSPRRETEETGLPETALSRRIESALESIGRGLSWVWLLLLAVIVLNVTLRYIFSSGRIELEEAQWHLYAVGFLGALAYCVKNDSHIRVDVLSEQFSPRRRAWIDLYGILLLALPFCALVLYFSVPFVVESYSTGEISVSPGGLPGRFLIKSALPLGFLLLTLGFLARLMRVGRLLFGTPSPDGKD
ncbi:MAG: TRAP transporter small permease subunit [Myxococcota bacterium]|nr:TRAP transporter small permease subunit [Myxococcota bacterium]